MKKIFLYIFIIIFLISIVFFRKETVENTVSFSSWGSQSEVKILKELLSDFEKENNIKVDFIHIPQNYFQKLHLLFASNLQPDVIFINNHYIKMYTDANLLEDLTSTISKEENEYHKTALNCLKDNDKQYAIPRDISSLVLYINKDIFRERNIKITNKIKTLEELKEISEKLTTKEHFAINSEEDPLFWLYFLAANGGGALSDNSNEIIINSEKSIEALNLYSDFINKYHYAPTKAQIGSMTCAQMFINGKIAMYLGGKWFVPKFKETITFDWDIIEFPSSAENKVYVDASGWAISKNSKNKNNALKLVNFLSSEKSITKIAQTGLITPARKIENWDNNDIFIKMLENTKPTPTNKSYGKINDILKEKAKDVFSGEKSVENAFDDKTIEELESLL